MKVRNQLIVLMVMLILSTLYGIAAARSDGSYGCDCSSCHSGRADQCAPVNQSPVANAGPDQSVIEGSSVALSGASSSDPDGSIASYSWAQTAGTAVTLSDPAAANPTFTAPSAGTSGIALTFQLTVTDNGGLTATDSCIVNVTPTVAPPANQPPVANAGPDQTVDSNAAVVLDASASTDPDDGIASYLWGQTEGPAVTLSDTAGVNPTFTAPDGGTTGVSVTLQLTVTDVGGLQSTDTCIININPSTVPTTNLPPVADAGPDQKVASRATVTLDGSNSSDPDDGIASYQWKQTRGPAVTLSSSTDASPTFVAPKVRDSKSLSFKLTVTDKGGMKSSDTCNVKITAEKKEHEKDRHDDGDHHNDEDD